MPDYQKNVIYKITCNDPNITDLYVGHSCDFHDRKIGHKSDCTNPTSNRYNYKVYQTIREYGGWENWSVEIIEEYPCENELEATLRERYWFDQLSATLNTCVPARTIQEWYLDNIENIKKYNQDNADTIAENKKNWQLKNKAKVKEQQKKYREEHADTIAERMKKWREDNRETLLEYFKARYQANKDTIAMQRKKYHEDNRSKILERKKKYHDEHKALLNQKNRKKYEANKAEINRKRREKYKAKAILEN